MTPKLVPILLLFSLLASACGGSESGAETPTNADPTPVDPPATAGPAATPEPDPTIEPTATPEPTSAPTPEPSTEPDETLTQDSPVEKQLNWFLEFINGAEPPTVADIEMHFTPEFLSQVPAQVLIDSSPQIFAGAEPPFRIVDVEEQIPGVAQVATVEATNGVRFVVTIQVQADEPGLIEGLFVAPGEPIELENYADIEALDADLGELGGDHAVGVFDVTDGACQAVATINPSQAMPLGSGFKLWILAELAAQVAAGTATWDEPLAIQDNLKSSPDGQVFSLDAGTELTLREHAELMISISDNAATDHLLARLGRKNVEAALGRIGIVDPEANTPMLSTGALFQLKFVAAAPNAADYRALDIDERASLLDELEQATLPWVIDPANLDLENANGVPIDQPRDLDLEWFGSPEDMCATMLHLAELADQPGLEPVAEILEINPGAGIPFDRDVWTTIRFKGGSEPGVLGGNWWLERNDGRRFVLAGMIRNDSAPLDETTAVTLLASALSLIPE